MTMRLCLCAKLATPSLTIFSRGAAEVCTCTAVLRGVRLLGATKEDDTKGCSLPSGFDRQACHGIGLT